MLKIFGYGFFHEENTNIPSLYSAKFPLKFLYFHILTFHSPPFPIFRLGSKVTDAKDQDSESRMQHLSLFLQSGFQNVL